MSGGEGEVRISDPSIRRLSMYYRTLRTAATEALEHISSSELAARNGVSSAQVRKDLSLFGNFGQRGLGYPVEALSRELANILGLDRTWQVVLVGAGNIGRALLGYPEFRRQGFHISAAFDTDPRKIGTRLVGVPVHAMEDLSAVASDMGADIGIIAVPAEHAQDVCDRMVSAGIRAVLNFAPVPLTVPEGVVVRNEDVSIGLESLSHHLTQSARDTTSSC